jgi:hypothetical protein
VFLALSRKRIAQHLQYSLACLAPMEELQTGCSRGVVGCDDALRVATESQLQESPLPFHKHRGLERRAEREHRYPEMRAGRM